MDYSHEGIVLHTYPLAATDLTEFCFSNMSKFFTVTWPHERVLPVDSLYSSQYISVIYSVFTWLENFAAYR